MKITQSILVLAAAGLAASAANAQNPGDLEVRLGSNPVLGSGTLFAALYTGQNGTGALTNVPAGAVGFNPPAPFTGSVVIGNSFTFQGLPTPGQTFLNINETGVYPGPVYTGFGTGVPATWTGVINVQNGFATSGSFTITLGGAFAGDTYTSSVTPQTAAFVASGVKVGHGVKVQNNVSLYAGVEVEDHVFIGPSAVLTNVINPRANLERKDEYKRTLIREGATIGANATIVCGVTLGAWSFVGAGAVVTRNVPDHALVTGTPARISGWMSRGGHRLAFDSDDQAFCPSTGDHYRLDGDRVICLSRGETGIEP